MTAPAQPTTRRRKRTAFLLVALILLLLLIMIWIDSNGTSPPITANPECEHAEEHLALPAEIANVPEYHDCQRLIEPDGKTYGALAGVFARKGLEGLIIKSVGGGLVNVDSTSGSLTPAVGPGEAGYTSPVVVGTTMDSSLRVNSISVAEIKSYDKPYPTLGIRAGLNCLYIVKVIPPAPFPYFYRALMISNITDDQACLRPPPRAGGKWLMVTHAPPPISGPKYPAVARWDWDPGQRQQNISMLCAPDWCDVGPLGMTATRAHEVSLGSPERDAPWEHKGRYDEQRLAIMGAGGLTPSTVLATASPHEELGSYTEASFNSFKPVARTVLPSPLPVYKSKFNFDQGDIPGITNEVQFCRGWRFRCLPLMAAITGMFTLRCWKSEDGALWWAKITASDGTVQYRCITRRTHGMVDVPATARWRWKANDEGLWARCGAGCCEVTGFF